MRSQNSSKMAAEVILDLIMETIEQCPEISPSATIITKGYGQEEIPIIEVTLRSVLRREDGHTKTATIGTVEWRSSWDGKSGPIWIRSPDERKESAKASQLNIASPTLQAELKAQILELRMKACRKQGKFGKKTLKRNRLVWS